MKISGFFLGRLFLGLIYFISGGEKLLSPMENFVYVIEGYRVLPFPLLEKMAAMVFPWIELIIGGFLILGLWTRLCLIGAGICTTSFIVIIGQALLRRLPLTDCGCFGDLVRLPLPVTLTMDILLWTLTAILFVNAGKTAVVSLDNYFSKKS